MQGLANGPVVEGKPTTRSHPFVPRDQFALAGTWTVKPQFSQAGKNASIKQQTFASKTYGVLGRTGTVNVIVNGTKVGTVQVYVNPRLYALHESDARETDVDLRVSPGLQICSLTFD